MLNMANIKRENPLSFNLDDDIYGSYENEAMRNQHVTQPALPDHGDYQGNFVQNLTIVRTDGAEDMKVEERDSGGRLQCHPFQIKTEEEDDSWSRQDNPANAQIDRSIPPMPQSHTSQMFNPYNNQFVYQNLQNPSNYQQMSPLDLYERHQQVFTSNFITAYQSSPAGMPNMSYFRPLPDQHNLLKDLTQLDPSLNNINGRKREIDTQFPKNLSPQADMNQRLQTQPNQDTYDAAKLHKDDDNMQNKETLRYNHGKLKLPNSLNTQQPTTSQLSNDYFPTTDIDAGMLASNVIEPSKKLTEADLMFLANSNKMPGPNAACIKGEIIAGDGDIGKGKFSCEECPYSCQSSAILKIHERTHTGIKPFSCNFCHYKSGQKNNVAKHILVHMKEKPFRCQYCDYKCAQKNNLVVHERTHTGEKPFVCTFCEYKTVQKPNLVKHMYLHTNEKPYSCDVCEYRCVQKTNLMKHKQKHSTEKPFECTECDYKSTQKANLNKHQILHMKNKPFQCDVCSFQCAQKCNLSKHRLSKHGLNSYHEISVKSDKNEEFSEPLNNTNLVQLNPYSIANGDRTIVDTDLAVDKL